MIFDSILSYSKFLKDLFFQKSKLEALRLRIQSNFDTEIVWRNAIAFFFMHLISLIVIYYIIEGCLWKEYLTLYVYSLASGIGITAGAHRLWAHKSYKARLPLRILLAILFAGAGQNDIYEWSRDHRSHHKYSETDADPHNSKRGFFFAHMGWLMVKKHPEVIKKGKHIDMLDLINDPVVRFHKKYYIPLMLTFTIFIPTWILHHYFGFSWFESFCGNLLRYCASLHLTWLVNSAAHLWGSRPYDKNICPRETILNPVLQLGEMYHNYHHTFPQDYKASEHGWFFQWNLSALFIDTMALLGLAYDLKSTPLTVVEARKLRTGGVE